MPQLARTRSSGVLAHSLSAVRATRRLAVMVVAIACSAVALTTSAQAAGCPRPEVGVTSVSPLGCSAAAAAGGPVACDARPGTVGGARVWRLPTGRDLADGDPASGKPVSGTRPRDSVEFGLTLRNCSGNPNTEYFRDVFLQAQHLGRAFRYRGVVGDAGLGTPQVRGDRITWGSRMLVLPPGTQATLAVRVQARRRGVFNIASGETLALRPEGPFAGAGQVTLARNFRVAGRPRPSLGLGGGLGAHTRVFVQTCVSAARKLVAHPPSRRVRRAGGRRVHLRAARGACSARRRLRGAVARRAFALPAVPDSSGQAPVPATCLLPPDAVGLGLAGVLISRRSWCSGADQIAARALVVILTPTGTEKRIVGTGVVSMVRRIDWSRSGGGAARVELGYLGLTGTLTRFATFEVRMRCEFAFGTTCAATPRGDPEVAVLSGTVGQVDYRLEPGAIPGGTRDFMQPWIELRLRAFVGGLGPPLVIASTPRPRCDAEAPGRQGCVWAGFNPTLTYSARRMPEITGHIQRSQAAGQPGNRSSSRPLTKVSSAAQEMNRRRACPDALVKRYRRERSGGSCDEYPFASTAQGGRGASTTNVPEREQRIQGGTNSGFYKRERVLTGDHFWVATGP
jgi:Deoxyribonuclease NucA/NucB